MRPSSRTLTVLAFLGFIALGLPDATTGIVWPYVSSHLQVPLGHLGFISLAFMLGSLASSLNIVTLLRWLGIGGLLSVGAALISLSLWGYAFAPVWGLYLASAALAGAAAGGIGTGLNAYASRRFSARQMGWLHGCWAIGASSGAVVASQLIARGAGYRAALSCIAVVMIPIAMTFYFYRASWRSEDPRSENAVGKGAPTASVFTALRNRTAVLQALILLSYVGVEYSVGHWSYSMFTKGRGFDATTAGQAVSAYWISLTVGRFVLGAVADKWGVQRLIVRSTVLCFIGGVLLVFWPGEWGSYAALVTLGFGLAPIYPSVMSQTPARMGELSDATVGLQISAGLMGQVALPGICGLVVGKVGIAHLAPFMLAMLLIMMTFIALVFRKPLPAGVSLKSH